jgi:arylsulfatase A-like enzyme
VAGLHDAARLTASRVVALLAVLAGAFAAAESRPNFVFILADDLGWRDLGCYDSSFYETPHLDRLASEGVRFAHAYAACPVCSPTRASLLTGKYPARMDTTDWFGAPQPDSVERHWTREKPLLPAPYVEHLPLEERTIAEVLRDAGYATFFAGKWHLGGEGFLPEDQGFDINIGGHHRGSPPGGYFAPYENPKMTDGPEGEHLPERLARETATFIRDNRARPFFAMLSLYSVHTPLQAREDLLRKYEARRDPGITDEERWGVEGERQVRLIQDHAVYAAMVESMDAAVGVVLDALRSAGIEDNTIVVFTSDNGGLSTSEGHPTSNLPLRAGKGWLYEGGIRVPLIIRWPGVTDAHTTCDVPVSTIDFYPTLLGAVGPLNDGEEFDGIDVAPLLHGETVPARELFWHYPHYGNQGGTPGAAILMDGFKLIEFFEDGRVELYDLANDSSEIKDLADEMPERVEAMRSRLHEWQRAVDAKFPAPNPTAVTPHPRGDAAGAP